MTPIVVIMLLTALLAGIVVGVNAEVERGFDPCEWVRLDLCKVSTGEKLGDFVSGGHAIQGHTMIRKSHIVEVVPIEKKECVLVIDRGANTGAVIGSVAEILNKLDTRGCKNESKRLSD